MKKITVGFSTHSGNILSWLIRKVEGTPYSHAYVKFHSDTFDRDLYYQASGLAVNFMGSAIFNEHCIVCGEFEFNIPDEVYCKVLQFAIDNSGKPYSIKSLFGIAYIKVMKLFGKTIHNPFKDGEQSYVCSELVSDIIKFFLESKLQDLDDISPKDLYTYISSIKQSDA